MSTHTISAHQPARTPLLLRVAGAAIAAVLLSLAGLVALAPSAHADTYTWDQRVVTVRSNVPASWGVAQAVRQWNAHRVDGQPRLVVANDAKTTDIAITTVREPRRWWTGLTTGDAAGSTITHITIDLNLASIHQSKYRLGGTLDAAKQWTTSHELGHALGLEHNQVERSVMSYSNSWRRTAGLPSAYDFRQLARLY